MEAGFLKESNLLNLRKFDSNLEGHPTPVSSDSYTVVLFLMPIKITLSPLPFQKLDFVDVATGSLGQGLGAACGMAYTGKYFDKSRLESVNFN